MVKMLSMLILLSGAVTAYAAQQAVAPSPSADFCLSKSELGDLDVKGRAGDVTAARKVGYHFMICEAQEEVGLGWFELAGDAGDLESRDFVVGLLGKWARRDEESARRLSEVRMRWGLK